MNPIKNILTGLTGYWFHKKSELPVGSDLFVDIINKVKYPSLTILFDVGANTGQTRNWFRFHVPKATIYCFEPVQSTFEQLKANAKGDANCILENQALGNEQGTKTIRLFEGDMTVLNSLREDVMNNTKGAKEETITVTTLDAYCKARHIQKIDLLKIDTEGFEINVLKGAEEMLQNGSISFVYCEVGFQSSNQRNTYFPMLTDFFAARDYYFFGLYQMDYHDWVGGNGLGNALYIHKSVFQRYAL
jgi:FkbM family methyltransferase